MIPFFEDDELKSVGMVPIFPLPQTVLLPGEPLPLHIFEERYKEMTESAISSKKLIAMAHLKPGWEKDYEGNPEIYDVAGLGKIVIDERLPDGKFNLLLLGLKRIKIKRIVQTRPYRIAEVEILSDRFSQTSSTLLASLESQIVHLTQELLRSERGKEILTQNPIPILENLADGALPLGILCDLAAAALSLPPMEKQMMLEETDVVLRAEKLIFALKFQLQSLQSNFPHSSTHLH